MNFLCQFFYLTMDFLYHYNNKSLDKYEIDLMKRKHKIGIIIISCILVMRICGYPGVYNLIVIRPKIFSRIDYYTNLSNQGKLIH